MNYPCDDPRAAEWGPEYDDDPDTDMCDHADAERCFITGEAHCYACGHRWVMTREETDRCARLEAEYERDLRREAWRNRVTWPWSLLVRCWRAAFPKRTTDLDDEIPF